MINEAATNQQNVRRNVLMKNIDVDISKIIFWWLIPSYCYNLSYCWLLTKFKYDTYNDH